MSGPRLLTIAGSDSGGGAGIQADLKTFAAFGGYGMSVVTAVTAQNTVAVSAVHEVPAEVVAAQLEAVFGDLGADAVKVGMLASAELVRTVAEALARHRGPPIVVDPVMVAKSGDTLLAPDAVAALRDELLPLATLVTPNVPETARLSGLPVASEEERRRAGAAIAGAGPAVLVKGGHAPGDVVVDLLLSEEGWRRFEHPRIATRSTHGTGCTLSSAIAAGLGAGRPLAEAVGAAVEYVRGAMKHAEPLGSGHGPLNHLWRMARDG